MARPTLVIGARDVADLLSLEACIMAVEQAFVLHAAGRSAGPATLALEAPLGSFHVKAAGLESNGRLQAAAKTNANFPGNPARNGLPTIQGLIALFDGETGAVQAVMDSIVVTRLRTGAATAVAAKRLARADASIATVFGAGEQGDVQVRALACVRPLRRVHLFDLDRARAERLARQLAEDLGVDVRTNGSPDTALAESQLCVTCTTATRPVVRYDQIRPGTFIAAVGADHPHKQELDPRLVAGHALVVDVLEYCATSGELHHALDAGLMTRDDVHADLAQLVTDARPGRRDDDEVFVFDSTGTALQDVGAAALVYERACESGRGLRVELNER